MIEAYGCDTSFAFSIYGNDVHSRKALAHLQTFSNVIVLSPFNLFELGNALRLAEFRKLIAPGEASIRIADLERDIAAGAFVEPSCNLATVLSEARRLSAKYTTVSGHRAFDVIHVACALYFKSTHFLTFDALQKKLAQSEGLKTPL